MRKAHGFNTFGRSAFPGRGSVSGSGALLTLEPLVEAVKDGVEAVGWRLSGLQKTTSHRFEGRWEGESTRSAYLFFHRDGDEAVGVDVYLDETSRGLQGNLALVVDGAGLRELGDPAVALETLASAAGDRLPEGYGMPLSVRLRLADAGAAASDADVEIRFKIRIPRAAIQAGASAVSAVASASVRAFEALLAHPDIQHLISL